MTISLIGKYTKSLLEDFKAAGIAYEERRPRPGVIMNSADVITIAEALISSATIVIVAWLKYSPTRKLMVTLPDNRIVQAEGRSVEEVEELLRVGRQIMAADAKNHPSPNEKPGQ